MSMNKRFTGFTLLEMAAVIAILGIVAAAAIPSYAHFIQRQQLRNAADALMRDLRNARELSVSSRSAIFVNYRAGKSWCWGVSRGQPCDCSGAAPPACNLSRGDNKEFPDVMLDIAQDLEFSPGLGQVSQHGAAALRTLKGHNLRVVLNPMGRASVCGRDAVGGQPC